MPLHYLTLPTTAVATLQPSPTPTMLAQDPGDRANLPQGMQQAPGGGGPGPGPAPAQGDGMSSMLMISLFLVVMLFLMSRKDSKARKEQQAMLAALKTGDRVVTSAGIHAVVHRVDETTVTLLLDDLQVVFDRTAVARIVRDDATAALAKG